MIGLVKKDVFHCIDKPMLVTFMNGLVLGGPSKMTVYTLLIQLAIMIVHVKEVPAGTGSIGQSIVML
jgi:hypothetical protein